MTGPIYAHDDRRHSRLRVHLKHQDLPVRPSNILNLELIAFLPTLNEYSVPFAQDSLAAVAADSEDCVLARGLARRGTGIVARCLDELDVNEFTVGCRVRGGERDGGWPSLGAGSWQQSVR